MSPPLKRILVIDDHPLIRAGVAAQLEYVENFEVCGEATNAREARKLTAELKPDFAVLDLMLGDEDGLTLVRELKQLAPAMRVVVLSMLNPEEYAPRAIAAGASAYVHKVDGTESIVQALQKAGDRPGSTEPVENPMPTSKLSDRELQVFSLIGQGRTTREISAALGVSPKTIDAHKEHIKSRLGLANAAQLTAYAARWAAARGQSPQDSDPL
ncbi:response regulator transcription factor [Synoicihabitans lomoniglobus]|uniref:Response regulator transcription factor n=1 Tax=Synoicihabitans lomoniglobus TaxID=2909285 RepID=A0AAE9ZWW2_9BACT|nr:response regulator transcription factor [Opitutaceae bacterium LMO-M01]WED64574.1 response regulator transcription factor [Opitutaceae bacterium LMO-M01]